jgi:hypothetical protein
VTPAPQYSKTTPVDPTRWRKAGCRWPLTACICANDVERTAEHGGTGNPGPHHDPYCALPWHGLTCTCDFSLSDVDPAPVAPAPDGHPPPDQSDADSERIRPAATIPKPLADAVAAVHLSDQARERWRLIQDLATSKPYTNGQYCRYCVRYADKPHRDDCLWLRANRLVDQTADRP